MRGWCKVLANVNSYGWGIPDEHSSDTHEAGKLVGMESEGERPVGEAVLGDGISDGMVRLAAEQLDISRGSGILEQFWDADRSAVLFCRVG